MIMAGLFSSLRLRDLLLRNRVAMSPMCQYSAQEGMARDWHLVHLGARAVGGCGLVMAEATAVSPEGRITPYDLGLWNSAQEEALSRIARFLHEEGAVAAIQLAHAGRKASTERPWHGGRPLLPADGGWQPVAPSPIPFAPDCPVPAELSSEQITGVLCAFEDAAHRALAAGFEVVEVHMAHGYLLHEFLSPLSNHRADAYGGSLENRMRFPLQVAGAVRAVWPRHLPVFVRISATDWVKGGWSVEDSVTLARELKDWEIDLIDCSSGGMVPDAPVPASPLYQVPFAEKIKKEAAIATGAVGCITRPEEAESIIAKGQADLVFLGRELLRNPTWPLMAAQALKADIPWPPQYARAKSA